MPVSFSKSGIKLWIAVEDGLGIKNTFISPEASESLPPLEQAASSNEAVTNPAKLLIVLELSTAGPFLFM